MYPSGCRLIIIFVLHNTIGFKQSPVDIETSKVHEENEVEVRTSFKNIEDGKMDFDGRNYRILYDDGRLTFKNYTTTSEWQSFNCHFHWPGEHTINGKNFDAEMHMVFKGVDYEEELAVVGLLFEADENAKKDVFFESLQLHKMTSPTSINSGLKLNLNELYGNLTSYDNYHYQGSTTFPEYIEQGNFSL